jgi:prophage regulatory protein
MRSLEDDESRVDLRDRLLRLPDVRRLFPVSKSCWYEGIAEGRYPRGVKLTTRAVAWRKSDIDALIQSIAAK